jgi:photosystem II stability/assembly factor-like uncharacterized protein
MQGTILVGTAGQGILRSVDDGATWHRLGLKEAIEFDGVVRSLAVDPSNPARVLVGADCGICLSTDGGAHFTRVPSPADAMTVWALAIDRRDPRLMYAGTGAPSRARMLRSTDAGQTWAVLPIDIPEFCRGVNRPRILSIGIDPQDNRQVWFGIEEGGAWRSPDQGDTWQRVDTETSGISSPDIHAIAILPATATQPKTHLVLTVNAVCTSRDDGQTWQEEASRPRFDGMYYTRTVQPLEGHSDSLLIAIGDGTPGRRTRIYRSDDRGRTWASAILHTAPNSTVWAFGSHPSDPALVFAGTKYGHLLRSMDGGRSWFKEWRDFSEITCIAWTPHVAPVTAHAQSIL